MELARIKNGANAASALLPSPTDGIRHATAPDTISERTGNANNDSDDRPPTELDMPDDDPRDDFDRHWSADELDPKVWKSSRKWRQVAIISLLALATPLASAVYTPALDEISRDLQVTQPSLLHLSVSAYILGFAAGPLLVSPISGLSGRLPIFRIGSTFLALLNLMCVFSSSINVLIVLRFLAGVAGSTPMALGPATVVDLFHKEERGKALSLMAVGDAPQTILNATLRPMLIFSRLDILPAILVGSFFYCVQVWLYIDIPLTYKAAYAFSTPRAGVIFVALGLGMILGLVAFGLASDKMMVRMAHGGDRRPEHRLPFLAASICILTLGMATYTLGTKLVVVWLVPAIGNAIMGAGLFCITVSVLPKTNQQKISFPSIPIFGTMHLRADCDLSALSVARFVSGAFFPVLAQKLEAMISAEAVQWGLTVTAALIMIAVLSWMLSLFRCPRLNGLQRES
ncbi:hypothetical protein ACJ41O_010498 [Fusarium nematophilum]